MRKHSGLLCLAVFFTVMFAFYAVAQALLRSGSYRVLISELVSIGNSGAKTGGGYSLLGSTGQLGFGTLSGGRYTINWGGVNSWRTPQADVSTAHAFPNPCSVKSSCNSVTFTRLTLKASVDIYTLSGELVRSLEKNNNIDSVGWDLKNGRGSAVAGGLYLYLIKGAGTTKKGKLVLVR